ncbi:alpha-2-HS-glycoprotein [Anguilla rostrata]|uniref:alpha-2-HS-glycoprotein n=1 Tax=Anguilla rostrata TaxID=7938 RepID=UPI0030CF5DD5
MTEDTRQKNIGGTKKLSAMEKLALVFVGTLLACSWAQIIEIIPLPCTDKTAEKIGRLAVTYINEDRAAGYKFSLNRITNVHLHVQGPAGKVYYLDLEVLETKCHVRSPKPWKHCDIRPVMETQTSGSCNVTILQTSQGLTYLYSYDCTLVPDEPEKLLRTCPHCPLLVSVNSAEAQQTAQLSLSKYNAQSTMPDRFALQNITRASIKNTPGQSWFAEYTIQETDCPEKQLDAGLCKPGGLGEDPAGFCVGAIHGKTDPVVEVSCEIFLPQEPGVAVDGAVREKKVPEALPAQHEKSPESPPETTVPRLDLDPKPPGPAKPPAVPKNPKPKPFVPSNFKTVPQVAYPESSSLTQTVESSSESSESIGQSSSEELGGAILRPPVNFWYKNQRVKRQAPLDGNPNHVPVFLSVFPASPSPFRSCPGAPRFSTV